MNPPGKSILSQPDQEQDINATTLSGESGLFRSGYIFLHRRILDNPIWHQLPAEWLKVWIGILLRANFRPTKWWDGHRQVDIPAGAFVTSIQSLANFCKCTPKQIRGSLEYLERANMVARQRASQYSIITVSNWETYQTLRGAEGIDGGMDEGTVRAYTRAIRGQAEGKRRATEEEGNKAIREEGTPPSLDFHDWLERQYARHPKKRDKGLAERYAVESFEAGKFTLDEFERVHKLMCASEDWIWKNGAKAPTLAQWILDEGWRYPPVDEQATPPSSGGYMSADEYERRFPVGGAK
jgi:hypothetical protein